MSALRWVRDVDPGIGGPAKAVLRDLADRADGSGVCWPKVQTIAEDNSMDRRTVQRALRKLQKHGLVEVKFTGRGSRYTLPVPCISDASEASERRFRGVRDAPPNKKPQ